MIALSSFLKWYSTSNRDILIDDFVYIGFIYRAYDIQNILTKAIEKTLQYFFNFLWLGLLNHLSMQ